MARSSIASMYANPRTRGGSSRRSASTRNPARHEDGGDDLLGLGNLIDMPGDIVTGLVNLGGVALKNPGKAASMFGRGLVTSAANLGETGTLGLAHPIWQGINDTIGTKGMETTPFWERESGILPGIVEDVGTAAALVAPFEGGASAASGRAATQAAELAAAGDEAGAAGLLAKSAEAGARAEKLSQFSHPYRTLWRKAVRPSAEAALETKLAASGVSGAGSVQEATGSVARERARSFADDLTEQAKEGVEPATAKPLHVAASPGEQPGEFEALLDRKQKLEDAVNLNGRRNQTVAGQAGDSGNLSQFSSEIPRGVSPLYDATIDRLAQIEAQRAAGTTPDVFATHPEAVPGETPVYHGDNPAEVRQAGDSRWFHRDRAYAERQAGPEGSVYAANVPDDVLAELEAARGKENVGAQLGPARSDAAVEAGAIGRGTAYELEGAPAAAVDEAQTARAVAAEERAGARTAAESYGRAEPALGTEARAAVREDFGKLAAQEAAIEAEKMGKLAKVAAASSGARRSAPGRFLLGTPTEGESALSMGTRLKAGLGERILAQDLRAELNTQRRFAEAGRRIALHSEPVQRAITVAKEHIMPLVNDEHVASRVVGDEIASRMNGIRALQDEFGVSDQVAVERGWRQEALPAELTSNPEAHAAFNDAVEEATQQWVAERKRVTGNLTSSRLGDKGLEGADSSSPTLTKRELRQFESARKDLERAHNLEGQVERERIRATKQVAGIDDQLGKEAGRLERLKEQHPEIIADFDRARSGLPRMWRNPGATWDEWQLNLFDKLVDPEADFHGFTFDPHAAKLIEAPVDKGRYVVGILPGVDGIPLAELTPETIDAVARYYQELFDGRPDVLLGGWVDDETGMVYIEPSQIVQTRSEAQILGQSRAQLAAWDLTGSEVDTNFGRPDVAGRFAGERIAANGRAVSNHVFRDRYASQLHAAAADTKLTPADVDHALSLNDTIAAKWGEVTGRHPDEYYSKMRAAARKTQPKTLVGRLAQTLLRHPEPTSDLWDEAERAGIDVEKARKWYFQSHDAIEKRWRGKEVTLLNGHNIDAADLIYQLLAVTSVSAAPLDNLASALTGLANISEFQSTFGHNQGAIERMVKEFMDTSPGRPGGGRAPSLRASSELFQHLGEGTHQMYTTPKYAAFDILSGHTITPYEGWDGWTTEYLRTQPEIFGGGTRKLSEAAATDEAIAKMADMLRPAWKGDEATLLAHSRDLVIREHQGSSALAKLLSFHDNLANPETSMAVTLDSWMERLFGEHKLWGKAGAYASYADAMRGIADDLSKRLGEKVLPHEVQAVFWAYAKQEISRQNVGILHGFAAETLDAIEAGKWSPDTDPFNGYYDLEAGPLREAEANKDVARDRRWNRGQLKKKVERQHPDWSAHKIGKEVDRLEEANPEFADAKVRARNIRESGGSNQVVERNVPVIRAEYGEPTDIRNARAMAPEVEKQRFISTVTNGDKVKEVLLKGEQYRTGLQSEMWDAVLSGDPQRASELFSAHVNQMASRIRDERWGDFAEQMNNPTGERLPAALDRLGALPDEAPIDRVYASMRGEITGATVMPKDPAGQLLIELYRGADFTTLVHEHAHVLRQMLPEADLRALEQAYAIKHAKGGWTWTRDAEERFANDFTGYLASGRATAGHAGLQGAFLRLRQGLLETWGRVVDAFQHNRMGAAIPEGTRALIDKYLNPDIAELGETPGFKLPEAPPEPRMLGKEAMTAPVIPDATGKGMYRSGVGSGRAIEQLRANEAKQEEVLRRMAKARKTQAEIKQSIIQGTLPTQVRQAALRGRATKTLERLMESADNPSVSRVPAHWQPMWAAAKDLTEEARRSPAMAEALGEDLPDTFTKLLAKADELGVNPTHVRNFTPEQVHRLVFQSMRLGKPNARLGEEMAAGTRYARSFTGASARSIESLAASTIETVWEARTNAVVDMIEGRIARQIEAGEAIPDGWVAWAPRKSSLLTDTAVDTGEQTARKGGYIIPKSVDTVLANYSKDFNQPVFRALNKVTNPWRSFVLTLSPRWYVNNLFGNIMLATTEGVRLQDWMKALHAFRKSDVGGQQIRFAETPFISGASFVSDIGGKDTLISRDGLAGLKAGQEAGGVRETARTVQHHLIRANEAVDELARAAVYFKTVRKGGSHAAALERAFTALVDYHALSPFEQQIVRSVVPFYAWQKGMLKLAARMPIDHPFVVPAMYSLGIINQQLQEDNYGTELPSGYKGLVNVGGMTFNLRGANPLADAASLATPEGIAQAINPLVGIALKKGFHAPGFGEDQAGMSAFGTVENDVNLERAFSNIGTGLPQARVVGAGKAKSYGVESDIAKFVGLPVVPREQVAGIVKRTKKTAKELDKPGAHVWPIVSGRKKKSKSSGRTSRTPGMPSSYRQVLKQYAKKG